MAEWLVKVLAFSPFQEFSHANQIMRYLLYVPGREFCQGHSVFRIRSRACPLLHLLYIKWQLFIWYCRLTLTLSIRVCRAMTLLATFKASTFFNQTLFQVTWAEKRTHGIARFIALIIKTRYWIIANPKETFDKFLARFTSAIAPLDFTDRHKISNLRRTLSERLRFKMADGTTYTSFSQYVSRCRQCNLDLRQADGFSARNRGDKSKGIGQRSNTPEIEIRSHIKLRIM